MTKSETYEKALREIRDGRCDCPYPHWKSFYCHRGIAARALEEAAKTGEPDLEHLGPLARAAWGSLAAPPLRPARECLILECGEPGIPIPGSIGLGMPDDKLCVAHAEGLASRYEAMAAVVRNAIERDRNERGTR